MFHSLREKKKTNTNRFVVDCSCHIFVPYVNYIVKVKSKHHGFFWIAPLSLSPSLSLSQSLYMGMHFLLFHFHSIRFLHSESVCSVFSHLLRCFFHCYLDLIFLCNSLVSIGIRALQFLFFRWQINLLNALMSYKERECVFQSVYLVVVVVAVDGFFSSCSVPITYAAYYICAYTIVRCFMYSLSMRCALLLLPLCKWIGAHKWRPKRKITRKVRMRNLNDVHLWWILFGILSENR